MGMFMLKSKCIVILTHLTIAEKFVFQIFSLTYVLYSYFEYLSYRYNAILANGGTTLNVPIYQPHLTTQSVIPFTSFAKHAVE